MCKGRDGMKTPDDPTFVYGNFEIWVCSECYRDCSLRVRNTASSPEGCPYGLNNHDWRPRPDIRPLDFYSEEGEL